MMTGLIDVHSHILPGIDDGCASLSESLACARLMVHAGYTHSFCTPHVWPNLPDNTIGNIRRWTLGLQSELDRAKIPLRLLPGGELNLRPELAGAVRQLPTYGMRGRFAIFDLWAQELPDFFEPTVRQLQAAGLTLILAHPERMGAVHNDPGLADYFVKLGLLLQGNLYCFADPPTAPTYRMAVRFLKEGRYFMLGSDLHRLESLPIRFAGMDHAIELAGEAAILRLMRDNPRQLLPE